MNRTALDWPDPLRSASFYGMEKLKHASSRGENAASVLQQLDVLDVLAEFDPVIAGTLPIGINIDQSDIDILCHAPDLELFTDLVEGAFAQCAGYRQHHRAQTKHVGDASVVRFDCDGFEIEVFATDCPTKAQYGFIHMLAEARILAMLGPDFAARIRTLKRQNIKTEPAFAQVLGLSGDPYIAVASLASLSIQEMRAFLIGKGLSALAGHAI